MHGFSLRWERVRPGHRIGLRLEASGDPFEQGGRHQRGQDGHDHEGGEEGVGNDAALEADVDDDQFHQSARVHQGADAEGVALGQAGGAGSQPAGASLAGDGRQHHQSGHQPEPGRIQEADPGVEAGVGEEQREQQGDGQRLDPGDQAVGDHAAGHGDAHHERPEHRVQPDAVGEPGTAGEQGEAEHELAIGEFPAALRASGPPGKEGTDQAQGDGDVGDAAEDVDERVGGVAVEAGQDQREEAPRGGVVDRAGAESDGSHGGAGEALEVDDPGQHGEGGDAHGGTEEDRGFEQGRAVGEQARVPVEEPAEQAAEDERRRHPGGRHGHRAGKPSADDVHAEFEPDHEHVGGQPELGDGEEDLHRLGREQPGGQVGPEEAEERGAEEDPGDHFGYDLRLAEGAREHADGLTDDEDHGDLAEELNGEVERTHRTTSRARERASRKQPLAISVMPCCYHDRPILWIFVA
jgi:hypothetical protein